MTDIGSVRHDGAREDRLMTFAVAIVGLVATIGIACGDGGINGGESTTEATVAKAEGEPSWRACGSPTGRSTSTTRRSRIRAGLRGSVDYVEDINSYDAVLWQDAAAPRRRAVGRTLAHGRQR